MPRWDTCQHHITLGSGWPTGFVLFRIHATWGCRPMCQTEPWYSHHSCNMRGREITIPLTSRFWGEMREIFQKHAIATIPGLACLEVLGTRFQHQMPIKWGTGRKRSRERTWRPPGVRSESEWLNIKQQINHIRGLTGLTAIWVDQNPCHST